MIREFDAREMIIEEHLASQLPHFPNQNMAKNKDPNLLGLSTDDEGSIRATKTDLKVDAALDASDPIRDTKVTLVGPSSQASGIGQQGEDDEDRKESVDCLSRPDRDDKAHQFNGSDELAEVNKCPLISSQEAEANDSDLEEQDVKVCDICGDTGREDLLAICSRCSDGAEHTYCMREMLDKVPEGCWLCEECKSNEETEKQRQGHSEILDGKERSKQDSDSLMKLRKKDSTSTGTGTDKDNLAKRIQSKRHGSDIEVHPSVKRQVLESMAHSSCTSNPGRNGALSRDNSLKKLDKMNANRSHQTTFSASEGLEKPLSPNGNVSHAIKGSFLKSNSFGTPKPKVKMVDEIPQKHKQGVDVKDASSKIVGKSLSFKGSLSRLNTTESKVKMLSPNDSHILEWRGVKQAKERTSFERKNSCKLDHSSGEVRRQHSSYPSGGGSSSTNSTSGFSDVNTSLSLKEGCTPTSSRPDGVDSSDDLSRNGANVVANGTNRSSAVDTSSVRSLKDGVNEENKLKAAIQAAMQKRLDMFKRNKVAEKSTMMSVSDVRSLSETASLDRPNSMNSRNSVSAQGMHEGEAASRSCGSSVGPEVPVDNVNQSKGLPAESMVSYQARDVDLVSSNIVQIFRKSAIPVHEFAWLGSFEVYRGENSPEHIYGIQAHISTSASYKVIQMVKKFPHNVLLNEVPRSCTWPTQFQDGGAEEDNVAVYFFARDLESYERSYKNLLEKMMKDDLALKGNIDGIELLIFPSKQLTKRSQRWNMLFFIWGVFRGRTENCSDNKSGCVEKLDLSGLTTGKVVTSDFMCPSETPSLYGSVKESVSTTEIVQDVGGHNAFASVFVLGKQSPSLSNGDCDARKPSPHPTNSYGKFGHHDRSKSHATCYHLEQVGYADLDSLKIAECQASTLPGGGGSSSFGVEMLSRNQNSAQEATSFGGSTEDQTMTTVKNERSQTEMEDAVKVEGCQMKIEGNMNKEEVAMDDVNVHGQIRPEYNSWQEERCKETKNLRGEVKMECELKNEEADAGKRDFEVSNSLARDVKIEDVSDQLLLNKKCPQDACTGSFEVPTIIGRKRSLNDMNVALDGVDESIKRSATSSGLFPCCDTGTHYVCNDSTPLERRYIVYDDEAHADSTSDETERCFFPVDSHPDDSMQLRDDSLGRSIASSGNNLNDGSPSLELALGVENRTNSGLLLGLVDGERYQLNPPDIERRKEDEEGNAALSLSLAFSFAEKGRYVRGTEQAFPERQGDK